MWPAILEGLCYHLYSEVRGHFSSFQPVQEMDTQEGGGWGRHHTQSLKRTCRNCKSHREIMFAEPLACMPYFAKIVYWIALKLG